MEGSVWVSRSQIQSYQSFPTPVQRSGLPGPMGTGHRVPTPGVSLDTFPHVGRFGPPGTMEVDIKFPS